MARHQLRFRVRRRRGGDWSARTRLWRLRFAGRRSTESGQSGDEAGDTLIEVLLALIVVALTVVSILGAFATTLAATTEHRSLANLDTVLRSYVETATYEISLSTTPLFLACAQSGDYFTGGSAAVTYTPPTPPAGDSYTLSLAVVAYEGSGCLTPTTGKPSPLPSNPPPQELTASVSYHGASDAVSFVVMPPHANTALGVSPNPAPAGVTVTITGTGFGAAGSAATVDFGTAPATNVTVVSSSQITATVPIGSGTVPVSVTTSTSGTSTSDASFTYLAVTSVTTPAPAGQSITVTGTGFTGAQDVNFGTTPVAITSSNINASGTQITVTVPTGASGTVALTVTNNNGAATNNVSNSVPFTYLVVSSVTTPAPAGQSITVTGTGFTGATQVNFGGTSVAISPPNINAAGTQITVVVPSGSSGTVALTVANNGFTSNSVSFTYLVVSSVTTPAPPGQSITVTGTGFTGATQVNYGAGFVAISPSNINAAGTQITVVVPPTTTGGTVALSVTNNGFNSNSVSFTYLFVKSITPSTGVHGTPTPVVITGTGFTGATKVNFGSTSVSINASNVTLGGTQITVTAPSEAAGAVAVTVTNNSFNSNSVTFTYT